MAEIVLHFRNRRNQNVTATVQTPVVIRFTDVNGEAKRVVVEEAAGVRAIFLNRDPRGPFENGPPTRLHVEPDDAGPPGAAGPAPVNPIAANPASGSTSLASPPPPPPPGGGPGVCYEQDQQTFCW